MDKAQAPVNQVAAAAMRNHSRALGATYLPIAAGPGPPSSAKASAKAGTWMGTIMLFNVWVLIWPNQKKVLGIVEASAEEIAKAKFTAAMASRTNVVLSVPMLLCMIGAGHGGYLF